MVVREKLWEVSSGRVFSPECGEKGLQAKPNPHPVARDISQLLLFFPYPAEIIPSGSFRTRSLELRIAGS